MPPRSVRERRVAEGSDILAQWLVDAARDGWARQSEASDAFTTLARRMVDAGASGLGRRVERLRELAAGHPEGLAEGAGLAKGEGVAEGLADRIGALHLLLESYARLAELEPPLAADIRGLVGFGTRKKDVLEQGARIADRWWVLGHVEEEEDDLLARRTWLIGQVSRRSALILDFVPPGRPLPPGLGVGSAYDGEVAFYLSAAPQRGLLVPIADEDGQLAPPKPVKGASAEALGAAFVDLDTAWRARAALHLSQPWLRRSCVAIRGLRPARRGDRWGLVDEAGRGLELEGPPRARWGLVAVGGGGPVSVLGELEGAVLRPLAAFAEERLHVLG